MQEGRIEAILSRFEEKIARSEQLRLAHIAAVVSRASDETRKVRVWREACLPGMRPP